MKRLFTSVAFKSQGDSFYPARTSAPGHPWFASSGGTYHGTANRKNDEQFGKTEWWPGAVQFFDWSTRSKWTTVLQGKRLYQLVFNFESRKLLLVLHANLITRGHFEPSINAFFLFTLVRMTVFNAPILNHTVTSEARDLSNWRYFIIDNQIIGLYVAVFTCKHLCRFASVSPLSLYYHEEVDRSNNIHHPTVS